MIYTEMAKFSSTVTDSSMSTTKFFTPNKKDSLRLRGTKHCFILWLCLVSKSFIIISLYLDDILFTFQEIKTALWNASYNWYLIEMTIKF